MSREKADTAALMRLVGSVLDQILIENDRRTGRRSTILRFTDGMTKYDLRLDDDSGERYISSRSARREG